MTLNKFFTILFLGLFLSCKNSSQNNSSENLLTLMDSSVTGVTFNNEIEENIYYNHILQDVVFNGGGVATVDINNDGLLDLYFCGNMVSDKLYLNKGNFEFEDISESSGITNDTWSSVVSYLDINNDGWQDIYVGKYMIDDPSKRENALYVNNGDLTFTERAKEYGIADNGHCTAANFFDYDRDGDLDLYIGNQPFVNRHTKYNPNYKYDKNDYTDRLFRNNGNGSFTDVTFAAKINNFNFTLSATTGDFNNDGWPDLYVASDYEEPDFMWYNNGDGTFTNKINDALKHISNFSMGSDVADFNNDLHQDIFVADMAPEDHYRAKVNMESMNPEKFYRLAAIGYQYQYMINTLQLNNGNGSFSEISQLAGVSKTDWSWASVFADIDNDGWKDLLITNGLKRDIRNRDYISSRNKKIDSLAKVAISQGKRPQINSVELIEMAPTEKLSNYLFKNNSDLTFSNVSSQWGFDKPSWSQGMALGDLDNDGDLDIVINNIGDESHVYQNNAESITKNNYIRISLIDNNIAAMGSRVTIYTENEVQRSDVKSTKGYLSSCEDFVHFGIGKHHKIDSIVIDWNSGMTSTIYDPEINKTHSIVKSAVILQQTVHSEISPIFREFTTESNVDFEHRENKHNDYKNEILLPHSMSRFGPALSSADINKDGLLDFYIGGAMGQSGELFTQNRDQTFTKLLNQPWHLDSEYEDTEALFLDVDNDGDQDLYVGSGGNERMEGDPKLRDRLYINENNSWYKAVTLPLDAISTGSVSAGDIDADGDLDLFIGGRQVPGKYGKSPNSYIYENQDNKYIDVSDQYLIDQQLGMVTDSKFTDIDKDGDLDLVIVGEWMPITIFLNNNGQFVNSSPKSLRNTSGWWNTIQCLDFDNDGDQDLIAGNLGLNIKFKASIESPFVAYVDDFDDNGTHDTYLSQYDKNDHYYPVRGRECSSQQMPIISEQFPTFDLFANATTEEILGDKINDNNTLKAYEFRSSVFTNEGNGEFTIKPLPLIVQNSCINSIITTDLNQDSLIDLVVFGNFHMREVETVRSDASTGYLLIQSGKHEFYNLDPQKSGILANEDVRNAILIDDLSSSKLIIANNNNKTKLFIKSQSHE